MSKSPIRTVEIAPIVISFILVAIVLISYCAETVYKFPFWFQESGRAGRDDKPAKCILFYRFADIFRLSTMVFTEQTGLEKLYGIVAYCLDVKRLILSLFKLHKY